MKTAAEDTRRLYFYGYLPFSLTGQNSVFRFVCLDGTRTFVFVFVALCSLPFLATPPCWRVYEDTYYLPCCVFLFLSFSFSFCLPHDYFICSPRVCTLFALRGGMRCSRHQLRVFYVPVWA